MEKRIQINGKWYVEEDSTKNGRDISDEIIYFNCAVYEDQDICIEAHYLNPGVIVEFHNKLTQTKDSADNIFWMLGITDHNAGSINEIKTMKLEDYEELIRLFFIELRKRGWLQKD